MNRQKDNGTQSYARLHKRGLTLPQQSAVDLLASGKNDTETAELLTLNRVTITKWRLYDPVFRAALNARRAELWTAGLDRLRALLPKALDVLASLLDSADDPLRLKAADSLIRLARPPAGSAGIGPDDADTIVRQLVEDRRSKARSFMDDSLDSNNSLRPFEEDMKQTWQELQALANGESDSHA
jgi:hypothetical protein